MDIDLPKVPWYVISVDVEDVIGSHVVDIEGTLVKNVIDSKGNILETLSIQDKSHDTRAVVSKTSEALDKNQGCNLKGNLIVNKVNGNFHISSHAFGEAIMILYAQRKLLDFTHTINHLSFGSEESISKITSITGGNNIAPLDRNRDNHHPADLGGHFHNTMTTYYLDITPTKYLIGEDEEYSAHEYTYSSQTVNTHSMPAIFFKFELSPIFINYRVTTQSFFVFLIRVCAIVGGVYTVAGIIETLFLDTVESIKKEEKVYHGVEMERTATIE